MNMLEFNDKLCDDVSNVFKNEMFIDFLDWIVEENYITSELYYVGYCGEKAFYNKVDRYVKRLEGLGYNVNVKKGIYGWNEELEKEDYYVQLYFYLN